MRSVAEQPRCEATYADFEAWEADFAQTPETRKSFDPLASVRMFRYDLINFGQVLPETRDRVRDEELSLLVEGVDRAARTEFVLLPDEQGSLTYRRNGEVQSYMAMLMTGLDVANAEAKADPRKQFLADAAADDLRYGYAMQALQPGEQVVWASPYRRDVQQLYGADFMKQCGRFPDRQMAFIYRAYRAENGAVVLQSQTIDRSDDQAIAAALEFGANHQQADMDEVVQAYDDELAKQHGIKTYAGRLGAKYQENAWKALLANEDLIDYFLNGLQGIASQDVSDAQLETLSKQHLYGVWAAFKGRLDAPPSQRRHQSSGAGFTGAQQIIQRVFLEQEVTDAFQQFVSQGRVLVGCGGMIQMLRGQADVMSASGETVFSSIFGSNEDQYGSLTFTCKNGHWNKRPRGRLIPQCRVASCKNSVAC